MLHTLLPLISVVLGASAPAPAPELGSGEEPVVVTMPRSAQVRLAVTLAEADAIHAVARHGAKPSEIVFAIDRDGEAFEVVATIRTRGEHKGEVIALSITDVGAAIDLRTASGGAARPGSPGLAIGDVGGLSWLGAELMDATAVTTLAVDEDGAVTITTSDDRAYMAIPGRGSGGNAGVEARWAAAWDRPSKG